MSSDPELLGFDTETTGVDPWNDRIVSASTVLLTGDGEQVREWIVDPGVPIPESATAVHGIDDARARSEGVEPAVALEQLTGHLAEWMATGRPLVVFNAPFDLTLLESENRRHGVRTLGERLGGRVAPVLDPLVLDKHADRYRRGGRDQSALAEHYGVVLDNAHDATADSRAAGQLARRIIARHGTLRAMEFAQLHDAQILWKRQQQESLAEWFRSQGKEPRSPISLEWPIETAPAN